MIYVTRSDYFRTLWKPFIAVVAFVIAFVLIVATVAGGSGIVLALFLLAIPRFVGFIPQSRAMGFSVIGAALVFLSFAALQFEWHNWLVSIPFGLGIAAGIYAWLCQYLMWSQNWNCYAPPASNSWINLIIPVMVLAFISIPFPAIGKHETAAARIGLYHSISMLILCWLAFHRQAIELFLEPIVWILYSIHRVGRTAYQLPPAGPLLIVANHASWLDPVFLAKVLPRPITPMMTSKFYDIWFLRPLLKYVFKVIVVPDVKVRREAPELQLAIAALDRGEVVVIFPEGSLRRKEEVPLKRFGQGVWKILRERPDTPVVSCWIEGSWGSYCSYFGGPPTKNKKIDIRRPIQVALSEPETVPEEMLLDAMPTRLHLMNRVLASREMLGLPPLPRFELLEKAADEIDE